MTRTVPVLLYHHVNHNRGDIVTVTPDVFAEQMHFLADCGYTALSLDELKAHIMGTDTDLGRAVVLTFDDGWLDNYLFAYPELLKYRFKASSFLITARVDAAKNDFIPDDVPCHDDSKCLLVTGRAGEVVMDWQLVRRIRKDGLMEFYSHTVNHKRSTTLDANELDQELRRSKSSIEVQLGCSCPYLCWPYGDYNEMTIGAARAAGYEALFTTDGGFAEPGSDLNRIRRIEVKNSVEWLKMRLSEGRS